MTRQRSLLELAGILTDEEAKTIEKQVKKTNQKIGKRIYKTAKTSKIS